MSKTLERILGRPARSRPRPDPLSMLIATILSQNTSDRNSHRAWTALRTRFPTWDLLEAAPLRSIRSVIRPGGMAVLKAARIRTALAMVREGGDGMPLRALRTMSDEEALDRLTRIPGVGVKTAACVLLFALGREVFPVDTHVHRLCGRLALAPGARTPEQTFRLMQGRVPRGDAHALHTNLIRFGRLVCRARNPLCGSCPFPPICTYPGRRRAARRTAGTPRASQSFMLLDSIRRS